MDWTSSLLNAVNVSDVVLIAVSARYRLSFERPYAARAGKGAADEARVLRAHLREAPNQLHPKAMVVVLPGATVDDIPPDLQMVERYDVSTIDDAGLEGLLRAIHGSPKEDAPATVRTMIGDVQAVPLLPSLEIEVRRRLERALKGTIERAARIAAAERSWRDGLGVLLDEEDVARLIDVDRSDIAARAASHEIIVLTRRDGSVRFPAYQFQDGLPTPTPTLARAHRTLVENGRISPWSAASWARTAHPELESRSPAQWAGERRDAETLLAVAERDAARLVQ